MSEEFAEAVKQLVADKGISEDLILKTIEMALLAAYKKKFGTASNAETVIDEDKHIVKIYSRKAIVEKVKDSVFEISLEEAKKLNEEAMHRCIGLTIETRPDWCRIQHIDKMLEFVSKYNKHGVKVILQVIELLKLPGLEDYYFDISEIEKKYAAIAKDVFVRVMHRRKQYVVDEGIIEFVKPLDNTEFCANCNRIRVTPDGKIKPCLLRNDNLVDAKGLKDDELVKAIKKAVLLREPYFRS